MPGDVEGFAEDVGSSGGMGKGVDEVSDAGMGVAAHSFVQGRDTAVGVDEAGVSPGREEGAQKVRVGVLSGEMQGGFAVIVDDIRVGASAEEQLDNLRFVRIPDSVHEGGAVLMIPGVDICPNIDEGLEESQTKVSVESIVQGTLPEGVGGIDIGSICQERVGGLLIVFAQGDDERSHAASVRLVRVGSAFKQGGVGRLIARGKRQDEGRCSRRTGGIDVGAFSDQLQDEGGGGALHAGIGEEGGEIATRGAIKIACRPVVTERSEKVDDGERICVARAMPQRHPAIAILDMGIGSGIEEYFYLFDRTIGSGEMQGGAAFLICLIGVGSGGEKIGENARSGGAVDRQTEWGIAVKIGNVHISPGRDEALERFSCVKGSGVPESCSPIAVLTLNVCSTSQEFLHSCIKIDGCSDH